MNYKSKGCLVLSVSIAMLALSSPASAVVITFFASGASAASIQSNVDAFRLDLGTLNSNVAGSFGSGRREINWDGVPDGSSAPNNLPGNFFNVNSPRGVVLSTPGTGFQVSATSASGTAIDFGNINANYTSTFAPFSAQRLFTAVGSTITDVNFFVPGTTAPALVRGFGSVFSDVDLANVSSLQFFDAANNSLGTFFVPNLAGSETFSFLGADFGSAIVSRVRITSGNTALGAGVNDGGGTDVVVMDDFIYGEPIAAASTPDGGSSALFIAFSFTVLLVRHARRSRLE